MLRCIPQINYVSKRTLLFITFVLGCYGHGGRTDSNGGHNETRTGTSTTIAARLRRLPLNLNMFGQIELRNRARTQLLDLSLFVRFAGKSLECMTAIQSPYYVIINR